MADNIINKIPTPESSIDGTEQIYAVKNGTTDARFATQKIVDKTLNDVDKDDVGLGNVDNTSDANKPISTAQGLKNTTQDEAIALNTAKNSYPSEDADKLADIELNATADQTDEEIEAAYNNEVDVVSQAIAETGTSSTVYRWTPLRVAQAIAARLHEPVTVTDTAEIDLNLVGQDIKADVKANSIAKGKLQSAVQATLDKADSAIQPGDLATVATSGDYNDLSNTPDLSVYDSFDQYADLASFPGTGNADVVYVAQDTGYLYRWTGSTYAQMSAELALGETPSTAYRGDRGKTAFDHTSLTNNPHSVTKAQVGLGNVPNLDTTTAVSQSHSHSNKALLDTITEAFTTALKSAYDSASSWVTTNGASVVAHLGLTNNPHSVTKSQVGLGSVDNTADADKPISDDTQAALDAKAIDSAVVHLAGTETIPGAKTFSSTILAPQGMQVLKGVNGSLVTGDLFGFPIMALFKTEGDPNPSFGFAPYSLASLAWGLPDSSMIASAGGAGAVDTAMYRTGAGAWEVYGIGVGLGTINMLYDRFGAGTPNGTVTAPVGATYRDITNGLLYEKATGTGNTGWVKVLVNKTASSTSNANLTPNLNTANTYFRTTQTVTLAINAPAGSPVAGDKITMYISAVGAQTINWNATYIAFGSALPTVTVAGKTLKVEAQYNGTNWPTVTTLQV